MRGLSVAVCAGRSGRGQGFPVRGFAGLCSPIYWVGSLSTNPTISAKTKRLHARSWVSSNAGFPIFDVRSVQAAERRELAEKRTDARAICTMGRTFRSSGSNDCFRENRGWVAVPKGCASPRRSGRSRSCSDRIKIGLPTRARKWPRAVTHPNKCCEALGCFAVRQRQQRRGLIGVTLCGRPVVTRFPGARFHACDACRRR